VQHASPRPATVQPADSCQPGRWDVGVGSRTNSAAGSARRRYRVRVFRSCHMSRDSDTLLAQAIEVAQGIEAILGARQRPPAPQLVAFGSLVRNRRLSQAIARIPEDLAYEALVLVRCLVETQINLSWIRLDPRTRAERFLKFEPLERLDLIKEMPESVPKGRARAVVERLEAARNATKSLFGEVSNHGKLRWAGKWAPVSLRDRLSEIMNAAGQSKVPFVYVLYRWGSSVVHGGPVSLASIIRTDREHASAVPQPLTEASSVFAGAGLCLLMTASDAAVLGDVPESQRAGIAGLIADFNRRVGSQLQSQSPATSPSATSGGSGSGIGGSAIGTKT
jgi:hypothetical protein